MSISELFPRLNDPNPMMLCCELSDRATPKKLYRVPIEHRQLGKTTLLSKFLLWTLPNSPSFNQLRCALRSGRLGLFAARSNPLGQGNALARQAAWGAIILFSPTEWRAEKCDLAKWQVKGLDTTFENLPYRFKDIRVFARLNFSPDCWFIVLRGAMAGKVFWWTHDGDSQLKEPWAEDIRGWGERVWREIPDVFGDIVRFRGQDTIDEAPRDAELCPERLVTETNEPQC